MDEDEVVPRAALRAEARRLVAGAAHRRLLPPRCHVGHPGGAAVTLPSGVDRADVGLLADLVERALDGLLLDEPPLAWVTRSGELAASDTDLAWLRAARTGFGRHGLLLRAFLVIGRHGYADLLHDAEHRWSRVRAGRRR